MSACIVNSLIYALFPGLVIGLISSVMWGPMSGVGRAENNENNWYLRKKKYGSGFKAWFKLFLPFTLIAYVVFVAALIFKCYQ